MIEAGARALCEAEGVQWKELTDGEVDWHIRDARAVLTAALAVAPAPDEGGVLGVAKKTSDLLDELEWYATDDPRSVDARMVRNYVRIIKGEVAKLTAALAAPASASRSEVVKKVLAEVHGQDPNRTYSVGEVKRLVYALTDIAPASAEPERCETTHPIHGGRCTLPEGHVTGHECEGSSSAAFGWGHTPAESEEDTSVSKSETVLDELVKSGKITVEGSAAYMVGRMEGFKPSDDENRAGSMTVIEALEHVLKRPELYGLERVKPEKQMVSHCGIFDDAPAEPSEDERECDVPDFRAEAERRYIPKGWVPHSSELTAVQGFVDGAEFAMTHHVHAPVSRDAELIAEAKATQTRLRNKFAIDESIIVGRLLAAYEEATK